MKKNKLLLTIISITTLLITSSCGFNDVSLSNPFESENETIEPTTDPTIEPTLVPTVDPTHEPTVEPTIDTSHEEIPENNREINYRDFYFNSNYLYNDGTQSFSQYTTLPVCLDNSSITSDYYYRNDLPDILFVFLVLSLFGIYIPLKIFMRLFRRFN
mgnify:CR=1 FL=1